LRRSMPTKVENGTQASIMNAALSLLISLGIVAFGLWVAVTAGSLIWTILAFFPVIVGLISLYGAVREAKAGVTSS
jgi:hypothetical protein